MTPPESQTLFSPVTAWEQHERFCVLSLKLCVHMSLYAHSLSGHQDISCWGVQEPCSSGSSEDPLVSPHTTPSLIYQMGLLSCPWPLFKEKLHSGSRSQERGCMTPSLQLREVLKASTQPGCLGDSASWPWPWSVPSWAGSQAPASTCCSGPASCWPNARAGDAQTAPVFFPASGVFIPRPCRSCPPQVLSVSPAGVLAR